MDAQEWMANQPSIWHNPILWSGVIAAGLAFFGVIAAQGMALWLNARQQNHDREQKKLDREMALRKEVFLEAAEWATDVAIAAGTLPMNIAGGEFTPRKALAAPARVNLVGSEETKRRCSALNMAFVEYLSVFVPRQNELAAEYEYSNGLRERRKALGQAGNFGAQFQQLSTEYQNFLRESLPRFRQFFDDIAPHLAALNILSAHFQVAMARDLGLEPNEDGMVALAHEQNRAGQAAMLVAMNEVFSKYEAHPPEDPG